MTNRRSRLEIAAIVISIVSLAVSSVNSYVSYSQWNFMNNYPPIVGIRDVSPLYFTENCAISNSSAYFAEGSLTLKRCALTGSFNLSFSVISPHVGTYKVLILSVQPESGGWGPANITIFDVVSKYVKGLNSTFANPDAWAYSTSPALVGNEEGNVPSNGFEKTLQVRMKGEISRSLTYSGSAKETIGTLSGILVYSDVQAGKNLQAFFTTTVQIA